MAVYSCLSPSCTFCGLEALCDVSNKLWSTCTVASSGQPSIGQAPSSPLSVLTAGFSMLCRGGDAPRDSSQLSVNRPSLQHYWLHSASCRAGAECVTERPTGFRSPGWSSQYPTVRGVRWGLQVANRK